jgi:uncharacterized protein with HEPN domain
MTQGRTYEDFTKDDQLRLAAERCVESIGEAVRQVSEDLRARVPDVPWTQIVGLRNIIVHGYAQLDHNKLWNVIQSEVPVPLERLSTILADE